MALTFSQEVWLAIIQAAGVLVGVLGGIAIGIKQASKAWGRETTEREKERNHQRELERDRLLRAERITVYRQLKQAAGDMLLNSALTTTQGGDEERRLSGHIGSAWTAALAEVQLVGSWPVVEAAQVVEQVRKSRMQKQVMRDWLDRHRSEEGGSAVRRWTELTEDEQDERMQDFDRMFRENDEQLQALAMACRKDIAEIRLADEAAAQRGGVSSTTKVSPQT